MRKPSFAHIGDFAPGTPPPPAGREGAHPTRSPGAARPDRARPRHEEAAGGEAVGDGDLPLEELARPRTDEYTPSFVERRRPDGTLAKGGGKGPLYARFLVEELKPFIDRTYRTHPDAASTAVGGASHGGLISLFLALEYPKVFGAAVVMSPSAMWDQDLLIKRVAALPAKLPVRLWVDVGALEGPEMVGAARRLHGAALAKGWKEGVDLHFLEQAGVSHDELAWASRTPGMLRFLWPARTHRSSP
jgi:predicted alpha/beta superfamily hydrolase